MYVTYSMTVILQEAIPLYFFEIAAAMEFTFLIHRWSCLVYSSKNMGQNCKICLSIINVKLSLVILPVFV